MKALSNMYYYICYSFDHLNNKSEEMTPEQIQKTKETLTDYCQTLLETIEQRTNKENIASQYFSSKDFDFLKKMSDDVKNILKMIN